MKCPERIMTSIFCPQTARCPQLSETKKKPEKAPYLALLELDKDCLPLLRLC